MEEQPNNNIEVTVKTLDSQSRSYTVQAQMTVKEFKEHISPSVGIPVDKQRLIYQGRVLQDEKTLAEYNVDGKVIHLVERAPPQTTQQGSDSGGVPGSSGAAQGGNQNPNSTSSSQGIPLGPTHDRNANSYVMLGTFNVPVNIMDPQQIQMSIQQMMTGLGDSARNPRVSTNTGTSGSVNVQIDLDQSLQSEPRLRLLLAENLLRDTNAVIQRLEGQLEDGSASQEDSAPPPTSSTSTPSPTVQPMDTSPPPSSTPPSSSSSTQTEGAPPPPAGLSHPSPAEMVEMLTELRRVEERLQPFIQRAHLILEAATTADYNNNTQERDEDQRILNLVGEALRLLGNALVALSDLRCNLLSNPPRHLHVIRPMSHYTSSVLTPGGVHHLPAQLNLGTTVTMSANGRPAADGQPQSTGQSDQQGQGPTPASQTGPANQQSGPPGPRVIRISHQTMEPVVMMQMNIDDSGNAAQTNGQQNAAGTGQPGAPPTVQIPGLPPEFMQAIVHQVTQQAMAMANAASTGQQGQQTTPPAANVGTGSTPPPMPPYPPQARVVFTRPSFTHRMTSPTFTPRGATINLRTAVPPMMGQQPGQAGQFPPAALNQMIGGLVGQLLSGAAGQMASQTTTSSSQTFTFSTSTSTSTPSTTTTTTSGSGSTQSNSTSTSTPQPGSSPPPLQENPLGGNLEQLLGSLLGGAVATGGQGPSITVTMPGVPTFIQGVTDFMQASQPLFSQPPGGQPQTSTPTAPTAPPNSAPTPGVATANEGLNPELFTGIVQGVLSTMMGSLGTPQNETESIAQFIQRLSQTSNIFTPGTGDAMGFFGDLLALVCQNFSMVDMVLLLHGQHHPLGRIQPHLAQFFTEHFLQGREPTEANITAAADDLIAELEEYITESFSSIAVRDGVDITQTNRAFLRQQLAGIATHILHCTDQTFGPRLLQLCNRALFECLALNLYCLNGEQSALTAVINHRIRTMSAEVNPSLVNWLTSMMTMRLQVILEHIPITEEQITHYIIRTQSEESVERSIQDPEPQNMEMGDSLSPTPATTAEEALASSQEAGAVGGPAREGEGAIGGEETGSDAEAWAAVLPPEWVPIIRQDQISQRKIKAQPPLSDAYLLGMPAKRRKMVKSDGPKLSLSEAVSQAAKSAGVMPISVPNALQGDLEKPELQEAYSEQLKSDIKKRVKEDPDYNSRRFPNTHQVFPPDS
ncbi:large proline-rich protein BAG6-like isoform X1 [Carassius gibelio]|uniref:large proline-rich protein BAG6-like isoform X1 n=1 Tax=Carassius gibelio TaxID=101364 RepID=UPI002277A205|nr:large proline-rich protein BAG6-like isoform X1 [Carassius gibelio]XP_052472303.1 large proline-rich protein BAG6-like isoform X1 [Carassius gibelio]